VCSSRLRVKNRNVNSVIGGVCGGLGGGLAALFTISGFFAGNVLFLGLDVVLFAIILVIPLLLVDKYVKVELEAGSKNIAPQMPFGWHVRFLDLSLFLLIL
jgi:predicted lipid-binding transport protein (Tim44 family)